MRYKSHLDSVKRTNTVNTIGDAPIGHRLHACERTQAFNKLVWEEFRLSLTQEDFINYPNDAKLRVELAKYHGVTPDDIMIFAGADAAINCAVNCFTESNSQVIMPEFHFPMYDVYLAQNNCQPALLKYSRMKLTAETLTPIIDPRLIIIANPNSPMGDSPTPELFTELEKHNVPIVVDMVYSDFGCTKLDIHKKLDKNYIFVHSFSKSFGGAGARVGYVIANRAILSIMAKLRSMFSITGPSIKFGLWALENVDMMKTYCRQIAIYRDIIKEQYNWNIGGNWVHLPSNKYETKLREAGFTFKSNCYLPTVGTEKLIRISVAFTLVDFL